MKMRFAFDTYREVIGGSPERRIHAIFTFALWFAAAAFVISTVTYYTPQVETGALPAIGGAIVSAIAAAIKAS